MVRTLNKGRISVALLALTTVTMYCISYTLNIPNNDQKCPTSPTNVYIYTQGRTGSSMLAKILQVSSPAPFYLFEPLHSLGVDSVERVLDVYNRIYSCDISTQMYDRLTADVTAPLSGFHL